jgi:curli biogenesis system outer membrane secretion channel CsgG
VKNKMYKRYHFFILLLITGLLTSCITTTTKSDIKLHSKPNLNLKGASLGLLPFYSNIPETGAIISDTIGSNLLGSGVNIIERTYLNNLLQEQGLSISGITENIDFTKIGNIINVNYLLLGTVEVSERPYSRGFGAFSKSGTYTYIPSVSTRIVNIRTGEVLISCTYSVPKKLWWQPVKIGENIASAITKELNK